MPAPKHEQTAGYRRGKHRRYRQGSVALGTCKLFSTCPQDWRKNRPEHSKAIEYNSCGELDAASGREIAAEISLHLNRHIGAIPGFQFLHNISYVNFNGAFAHVQIVSYYLIRLAFLDRSSDRQFTTCEDARYWWLRQHVPSGIPRKQAVDWRIGPPARTNRTASIVISNPMVTGI